MWCPDSADSFTNSVAFQPGAFSRPPSIWGPTEFHHIPYQNDNCPSGLPSSSECAVAADVYHSIGDSTGLRSDLYSWNHIEHLDGAPPNGVLVCTRQASGIMYARERR